MFCAPETTRRRAPLAMSLVAATVLVTGLTAVPPAAAAVPFEIESLDGFGNNLASPTWGQGGLPYSRVATARYADGRGAPFPGPNSRMVSNRLFNDVHQNVVSERSVTQWGFTWGQFLDHTFGLRLGRAPGDPQSENANIPFNAGDPLESFRNDLGVVNQLRSMLFQIPVSGNPECLDGPGLPECFRGVVDLGAIDIERGRDHGMPTHNQLRQAYGLPARTSFTAVTGESTDQFPPGTGVDNPTSLNFAQLKDIFGVSFGLTEDRDSTVTVRETTLAARPRAIYGSVDNLDAFTGMVTEPHVARGDLGEPQRAIWTREFQRLRDGDRFCHTNDPGLTHIRNTYIPRSTLAGNVFFTEGDVPPASCRVRYQVFSSWQNGCAAGITITNTGNTPKPAGWTLRFVFDNGQQITDDWNGTTAQDDGRVPFRNESWNATIPAGGAVGGVGFTATWNTETNSPPRRFTLNTTPCTTG